MSNSPLVTYTRITKNKTSHRNHAIDTITIHCIVGQWTAKQGCDYFATTDRECSANYVVGKDGSIGLSVDEKDRSWCSSNGTNDNRAITIEVASDTTHPYAVTAKAYAALLDLVQLPPCLLRPLSNCRRVVQSGTYCPCRSHSWLLW